MNTQEIFEKIASRMVDGLMFHSDMAVYFHFLGLYGYKKWHEHQYLEEINNHMEINTYYMDMYDKFLPQKSNFSSPIPQKWYSYTRQQIDMSTKAAAAIEGFSKWVQWEEGTLKCLKENYNNLMNIKEFESADFLEKYIKDVREELILAKRKYLELKSMNCDMPTIIAEQEKYEELYKV